MERTRRSLLYLIGYLSAAGAVWAFVALGMRWSIATPLVWIVNVFGTFDLLLSVVRSSLSDVSGELHAAWYVTGLLVPLSGVSHEILYWAPCASRPLLRWLASGTP